MVDVIIQDGIDSGVDVTEINVVTPGIKGVRVTDIKDAEAILDVFQAHGHKEIDTARPYGAGSSETVLARLNGRKAGWSWRRSCIPVPARRWET